MHRRPSTHARLWPLVLTLVVSTASAAPWKMTTNADVDARAVMLDTSDVDVGRPLATDTGHVAGDQQLESRLRLGANLSWIRGRGLVRAVNVRLQADAFHAPLWTSGIDGLMRHDALAARPVDPVSRESMRIRRARVQVDGEWGRISAGRMMSNWGLGLLAQSGDPDPYQFGIKRDGVIVDRIQLATAPLLDWKGPRPTGTPLFFIAAADRVVFDDLADMNKGDRATNIIGAILYRGQKVQAGAYAVIRRQTDERGPRIDANAGDIYARWSDVVEGWRLSAATEWLMLTGETTYFRTAYNPDVLKIQQFGGVVRLGAEKGKLGIRLEGGVASGDDAPFDDTVANLKFSREYRVGLVMFHEGVRRSTATMTANLSDPRYLSNTPTGFERAASNGSVTGAVYVAPTVRYSPIKQLTLLAGGVWADAPVPMVDAYLSGLGGGAAVGPRGGAAASGLGWEVDAAAAWKQDIGEHLAITLRGDWGRWQPGAAFDDASGKSARAVTVWMGRLTVHGHW